jgi:glycosyl-4,4'-diaponeurosporenoate acyltransferase
MAIIEMSNVATVVVDIAAWAVIHAASGYIVHRLGDQHFDHDGRVTRITTFEADGRIYERMRIRRWKDRLPEAGALFAGGLSKAHLPARSASGLRTFATATRRAELGHWLCAAVSPVFVIWNRPVVAVVMVVYGVLVNLPFIAIQRYNRLRIGRLLSRASALRSSTSDSGAAGDAPGAGRRINGNNIP